MTAPGYDYKYSTYNQSASLSYTSSGSNRGSSSPPGPNGGHAQSGEYPQPEAPITVPPSPGKTPQEMMMMSQENTTTSTPVSANFVLPTPVPTSELEDFVLPTPTPTRYRTSIPGCPPGLEYLAMVDRILVKQQIKLAEILFGWKMKNKYKVMNSMGQQIYFAVEDTNCCTRNCCGSLRPFEMQVLDNFNVEVLHFSRPLRCQGCCCCCLQTMQVSSPSMGTVLGYVNEVWSICIPKYTVHNAANEVVFHIEGPLQPFITCIEGTFATFCSKCCAVVEFKIFAKDGTQIGAIRKHWMGFITEGFTHTNNFNISFPLDLDVPMKAVLLGALMLIDFMYFESQQNNK